MVVRFQPRGQLSVNVSLFFRSLSMMKHICILMLMYYIKDVAKLLSCYLHRLEGWRRVLRRHRRYHNVFARGAVA